MSVMITYQFRADNGHSDAHFIQSARYYIIANLYHISPVIYMVTSVSDISQLFFSREYIPDLACHLSSSTLGIKACSKQAKLSTPNVPKNQLLDFRRSSDASMGHFNELIRSIHKLHICWIMHHISTWQCENPLCFRSFL